MNESPTPKSVPASVESVRAMLMALACIRWQMFGECRTEDWDGPPPRPSDTEKALSAALRAEVERLGSGEVAAPIDERLTEEQIADAFDKAFPGHDLFQESINFARYVEDAIHGKPTPLAGCACRWNGEKYVSKCELHEAWHVAIHEWAERAKTAEAVLAAQSGPALIDNSVERVRALHGPFEQVATLRGWRNFTRDADGYADDKLNALWRGYLMRALSEGALIPPVVAADALRDTLSSAKAVVPVAAPSGDDTDGEYTLTFYFRNWNDLTDAHVAWMSSAALAGAATPNPWKEAVLDELAQACMDAPLDEPPSSILKRVIAWNIQVGAAIPAAPADPTDAELIERFIAHNNQFHRSADHPAWLYCKDGDGNQTSLRGDLFAATIRTLTQGNQS